MNKMRLLQYLIIMTLFIGCSDAELDNDKKSKLINSVYYDFKASNDLQFGEISLKNESGEETNVFTFGELMFLNIGGIENLTLHDNRPNYHFKVVFKNKETGEETIAINEKSDPIKELQGKKDYDVNSSILLLKPFFSGEYELIITLKDINGEGDFSVKTDIEIIGDASILINSKGISVNQVGLFKEINKKRVKENEILNTESNYVFVFFGLKGFQESEGKVSFGGTIEFFSKKNLKSVTYPIEITKNVDVEEIQVFSESFNYEEVDKVDLIFKLHDLNSDRYIEIKRKCTFGSMVVNEIID